MDEDFREEINNHLLTISKEVQAVGRKIGSTRINGDDLIFLSQALSDYSKALKTYAEMLES